MKYKLSEIKQLRKNFCSIRSWLQVRKKQSEIKCPECKRPYIEIPHEKLAIMSIKGKLNQHLCNDCADKYIALGIEDIDAKIKTDAQIKDDAIIKIKELLYELKISNAYKYSDYYEEKLNKMKLDELNSIIKDLTKKKEYKLFIESIDTSDWAPIDEYLVKQYNVYVDENYLKHESQIEEYFSDDVEFDCGQGFYQDKKIVIVAIADKFYEVTIYAEIGSAKQNIGDRLYWVESIKKVKYKEIEKPLPKDILEVVYNLKLTREQKDKLDEFIKKLTE